MTRALPTSTYRYQISPRFTLFDAAADLPRIVALGVDAAYLSPVLTATTGSDHGYDWVDCRSVDPQRGGEEGWAAFIDAARALGLKVVLDIVPNHCGIAAPEQNPFWWSVLREGRDSEYAHWFDIDWTRGPILIPKLGADGDLSGLRLSDDSTELVHHGLRLPVAPGTASPGDDPVEVAARQHYRLGAWPLAATELNYRRFFTVDTLAGLRIEDESVFEATHARIFRMVDEGQLQGIRVDHPDGLADPGEYFRRLRARVGDDMWLLAEKILGEGEPMPDWPIDGTTGYDAIAELTPLFTDPASEAVLTEGYVALTGDGLDAAAHVERGKRDQATGAFGSEISRIIRELPAGLSEAAADDPVADNRLQQALIELAINVPAYRSYVPSEPGALEVALANTRRGVPGVAAGLDQLAPVLHDGAEPAARRFEQLTGALMAKGLEDTAWYRYARWIGANEVGGNPARVACSLDEFHAAMARRQAQLPQSMTTLSTHDTKRGEDVRAALESLTELPDELQKWSLAFQSATGLADRPFAHLLAQTLAAVGPVDPERMHAYATKAMREAATSTSWASPDEEFESSVHAAIDLAYADESLNRDWVSLLIQHAPGTISNMLSQKLVQLTMPGIPDVYQGTEITDDSLVDPDNRRLPDQARLAAAAQRLVPAPASTRLGESGPFDSAKHWVVKNALTTRRERPELFTSYRPIVLDGPLREHLVAFDRGGAITLATRMPHGLLRAGRWGDASLTLDGAWTNVLGENTISGGVALADMFEKMPVALLVRD
ncbi:malto-oligosyltrehalose synthase [Propionibacteriaceae bacterium G1746]